MKETFCVQEVDHCDARSPSFIDISLQVRVKAPYEFFWELRAPLVFVYTTLLERNGSFQKKKKQAQTKRLYIVK